MIRSSRCFLIGPVLVALLFPAITLAQQGTNNPGNSYLSANGTLYTYVEQMPGFSGNLNLWLSNHIKYPRLAIDSNWEGRAVVKFLVESTGTVSHAEVVKSSGHEVLDREAARVINEMPAWAPGKNEGKPVNVYFQLPITFKLEEPAETPPSKDDIKRLSEQMPSFKGDMAEYLSSHIVYPESARRNGWTGRVQVKCIINETGGIEEVTVQRSSGYESLDKEAVRVVRGMLKWKPATNNGVPVKVYFSMPISFRIS